MATQNPIESEGTYPLPEAQVDRFMLKIVVDYPHEADELTVIERALADPVQVEQLVSVEQLAELQLQTRRVYVDPAVSRYALEIALATRKLAERRARRARRSTSRTAPARAARSTSCSAPARSPCCAAAATCCRRTCASSRRTCCATAWC